LLKLATSSGERGESYPGMILLIRRSSRSAECAKLHELVARAGESGLANNINFV
jgi:hypothetical protein